MSTDRRRTDSDTKPSERRRAQHERYREVVRERLEEIVNDYALSPREREVFELLLQGWSADEIASKLGVTSRTVRFHQTNVLDKLDADSRLDLFRMFFWPE